MPALLPNVWHWTVAVCTGIVHALINVVSYVPSVPGMLTAIISSAATLAILVALLAFGREVLVYRFRTNIELRGTRTLVRALVVDFSRVVHFAQTEGVFFEAAWRSRLERLLTILVRTETAGAFAPDLYSRIVSVTTWGEHVADRLSSPESALETPRDLVKAYRRRWPVKEDRATELAHQRLIDLVRYTVEQLACELEGVVEDLYEQAYTKTPWWRDRYLRLRRRRGTYTSESGLVQVVGYGDAGLRHLRDLD